jgi:hypothetical protein
MRALPPAAFAVLALFARPVLWADEPAAAREDVEWLLEHRPPDVDANLVLQLQAASDERNAPRRSP